MSAQVQAAQASQGSQLYMEALSLDANLLSLVIERNRKQHCRAAYFRRLDMLIRSMKRYRTSDIHLSKEAGPSLQERIGIVKENHERMASVLERHKGVHKRRGMAKVEDEQWSLETKVQHPEEEQLQLDPFLADLKILHAALSEHLPEVLSRIMFAGSALYTELSRGYFAPLCTVALACISRIRVLILRLGRDVFVQLDRTVHWLKSDVVTLVTAGGELEKQIGLSARQVKQFLSDCNMEQDLFNNFMDPDYSEVEATIRKRKVHKMMKRGESSGLISIVSVSDGKTTDKEASASEEIISLNGSSSDPKEMEIDIIGELVDTSHTIVPQDKASSALLADLTELEKQDSGDRNLEMLALLKEKKSAQSKAKSAKKRKAQTDISAEDELKLRRTKIKASQESSNTSNCNGISTRPEEDEKKKKKKSKKKKKKSARRDIIDDIFDF